MDPTTRFPDGILEDAVELGAVTDRSVRVWLRQPGAAAVEVELQTDGLPPVRGTAHLSAETDWTGAVELALPVPAPDRPVVCVAAGRRRAARFAPAPEAHPALTFGFGSCHRPFEAGPDGDVQLAPTAGIYPAMQEELRRAEARFVLLVGDQVYADELPSLSVRDDLPGDADSPPPLDLAIAAYRRISRGYLGQSGFKALRATFPTCCMWDDHDIFNNWGSRLTETPFDRRLFEAASHVFCEYQGARNPGATTRPPPYDFTFRYGSVGFLVLDVRGARSYEDGTMLGRAQWERVRTFLAGAEAEAIQTLFVVVSVPIAHVSRWVAEVFEHLPGGLGDSVRDRWCSRAFVDSRDALLDALLTWERAAPHRQVALLSGDVHAAGAFTIQPRGGGPGIIQQFTSSAMSNPPSPGQRRQNRLGSRWPNLFEPRFRFARRFVVLANNYGLVRLTPLPSGGHRILFEVGVWDPARGRLVVGPTVTAMPGGAGEER